LYTQNGRQIGTVRDSFDASGHLLESQPRDYVARDCSKVRMGHKAERTRRGDG
jgi:hypothetical protein